MVSATLKSIECGLYLRGTELTARFSHNFPTTGLFYFQTRALSKSDIKLISSVTSIRDRNNRKLYQTRPHKIAIGQIKLYESKDSILRCKIEDLYTVPFWGELKLEATIFIIDRGFKLHGVRTDHLYDFPQSIRYIADIEPEAKCARIPLYDRITIDTEIDKYIKQKIRETDNFRIRILDYIDDVYLIDLIDIFNNSIIENIKCRFKRKFINYINSNLIKSTIIPQNGDIQVNSMIDYFQQVRLTSNYRSKHTTNGFKNSSYTYSSSRSSLSSLSLNNFTGSTGYYRNKFKLMDDIGSQFYLKKRFFKVKVLTWQDPDSITIVPSDVDYIQCHEAFKNAIDGFQEKEEKNRNGKNIDILYKPGENCYFRNEYVYPDLGKWLRGVILGTQSATSSGGVLHFDEQDSELSDRGANLESDTIQPFDEVFYRVLSIDYGFYSSKSAANIRKVEDMNSFLRYEPYALRCSLYGIYPITHENSSKTTTKREFSSLCHRHLETWMREKLLDYKKETTFHVLFRNSFYEDRAKSWKSGQPLAKISLFHETEPPFSIEHLLDNNRRRRTRFTCLNWCLVTLGVASSHFNDECPSSHIELDEHIVNLLVSEGFL